MAAADIVIRGGQVVDGNGGPSFFGDVAIKDGKIVFVGDSCPMKGVEEVDAAGQLVTPGWVDCHTHYDAQVGWDPTLSPSCWHGVTSVVFGNCGVTFAPCWQDDHEFLIELMEGVEDIPGTALHDGIRWNWQTFPEFLDELDTYEAVMDFAPQIGHAAVRSFVLGERCADPTYTPTEEEISAMSDVVQEAVEAGAAGWSSTFAPIHMDVHGNNVPGCFADLTEVLELAKAAARGGYCIYECAGAPGVSKNGMASLETIGKIMPVTYTLTEAGMEKSLAWLEKINKDGCQVIGQIFARAQGLLLGLNGVIQPLSVRSTTYLSMRELPLEERVVALRKADVREAIIREYDESKGKGVESVDGDPLTLRVSENFDNMWVMGGGASTMTFDYEPRPDQSIASLAKVRNVRPQEILLDAMMEDDGHGIVWYPYSHGYTQRDYNNVRMGMEGAERGLCVLGNADAGAHVAAFTDASCTTFMLTHWSRDRTRGEKLPLEKLVKYNSRDPARLYGWKDRGTLEVGMRADVNVIDLEKLRIHRPEAVADLPSGATRWIQRCSGYTLTICAGVVTVRDNQLTGATPGRLIRNPSTAVKRASGQIFSPDLQKIRSLREAGRGMFDVRAGVDRSDFIAHMPGPISQAFYRAERKQQAFEATVHAPSSKL